MFLEVKIPSRSFPSSFFYALKVFDVVDIGDGGAPGGALSEKHLAEANGLQGWAKRLSLGCVNAAGKAGLKW